MFKVIITILIISTPVLASTLPFQSKEIIEIYSRTEDPIYKDLSLEHTYAIFDEIFILPNEFYGEAEFYDLKFYIDMDTTISNNYDANCYRILYESRPTIPEQLVIPEPATLFALIAGFAFLKIKRIELPLRQA